MGSFTSAAERRPGGLPPGVTRIGETPDYFVGTWRNVMLQHVSGAIDLGFLRDSLAGHHGALQFDPEGYGVITLVEPSARIPGSEVRDEASRLRQKTQHMLKAQSVLIGGEGFFASTMRAVITGIVSLAQSRVPLKMASNEQEAGAFIVERVCPRHVPAQELVDVLRALRQR